ncbi:MAG TPA: NAD(P)/FAD-dependent oxidoreductase, partial [Cyclobacteriaceae bacterium]|nr:NAD(P)/FAD-dependent oxidoreductase [Cyclobacteriaceae bacterium]
RLFTPARYDGLPGMPFPAHAHYFPTKDEMADFLEHYAQTFELPVMNGVRVDSLTKENGRFVVQSGNRRFEADHVIIAMANYQQPKIPAFANDLDPDIVQFHSHIYRNPNQVQAGGVLLVGAGNSGSEIAMELSRTHKVYMSGRDTGHIPFRIASPIARFFFLPLVLRVLFHRIFTIDTPIGRNVRKKVLTIGGPLIRVKPNDLKKAGVVRVSKAVGMREGKPLLEDGTMPDVKNVIWCTGFHPGFSWIKLPVMGEHEPNHRAGIVESVSGLYFTGLHFLYSFSSTMIQGTDRDAKRIVRHILNRMKETAPAII